MKHRQAQLSAISAVLLVALASVWSDAHAQAWVGDKGSLDLNLDYNLGVSRKVVCDANCSPDGDSFPASGSMTHQITLSTEFVPVRGLAVSVGLPIVMLKYTGDKMAYPHMGGGRYDDGKIHTTLTDIRAGMRYQIFEEAFAFAPHVAVSIPVADYETVGNTVAGRHLKMLHAGFGIGRQLGDAAYVHFLYEFSLVERYDRGTRFTEYHNQNRTDLAFTIGYKLFDIGLDLHLDANVRRTHGGLNFSETATWEPDELLYHDALLNEDMLLVGGGVGYQLSNTVSVNLAARFFVDGANTQNASVFALGLGWSPL